MRYYKGLAFLIVAAILAWAGTVHSFAETAAFLGCQQICGMETTEGTQDVPDGDVENISSKEFPPVRQLLVLQNAILVLREDGTVVPIPVDTAEDYYFGSYIISDQNMQIISQWKDIKELAASIHLIIGLKIDGTVEAIPMGEDPAWYLNQAFLWTDAKKLAGGYSFIAGLRENGTVVTAGEKPEGYNKEYGFLDNLAKWTDIVKLEAGVCAASEYAVGLRSDGTMVYEGIYNAGWTGPSDRIVDFGCSGWMLIAVREDGTVTANGEDSEVIDAFLDWKDIKQVDCGDVEAIGLRQDGTILVTKETRAKLQELTDVERIELEMYRFFAAYRKDGSVWIETYADENLTEETRAWTDIQQVYVSLLETKASFILGLKNDGTVVAAGIDFDALYQKTIR